MKMNRPFFSIIIATYNSEPTLEFTLRSILTQDFPVEERELLVVDGGSTDQTRKIAEKYGAHVLENPKRLPEFAKLVGVHHARGHYVIRMDSDEELSYPTQLADKKRFLEEHSEIKVLISNRLLKGTRINCGISAAYMNSLGDPFSYFYFGIKGANQKTYARNIITTQNGYSILQFHDNDIIPLADSGTCSYSLDYVKEQYPGLYDTISFTCSTYDHLIRDTGYCGIIEKDSVYHNCNASFQTYLSKLRFRVINNLFHKEESGFSSKSNHNRGRLVLFILYTLCVPLPILDSVRLSIIHKSPSYLLHFIYLYYVCIQILRFGVLKISGKSYDNKSFGKE